MQHLFSKLPAHVKTILKETTAVTEWSIFIESVILDKNAEMAGLSVDCSAEKLQRKYLILRAQKAQLEDLLDLFTHITKERQR